MKEYKIGDCVCVYKLGDRYVPPRRVISTFGIIVNIDRFMNMKRYKVFSGGEIFSITSDYLLEKVCTK